MCIFPACCFRQKIYEAQGHMNGGANEARTHLCSFVGRIFFSGFVSVYVEVAVLCHISLPPPLFSFLSVFQLACLEYIVPQLVFDNWYVIKFFVILLWVIACVRACVRACVFSWC